MKAAFAVFAAGALLGLVELVDTLLPDRLQLALGLIGFVVLLVEVLTLIGVSLAGREEGVRFRWTDLPLPVRLALAVLLAVLAVLVFLGNAWTTAAIQSIILLVISGLGAWRTLLLRNRRQTLANPPY